MNMSGIDQLFDRFGNLLRSWTSPGSGSTFANSSFGSGDPFLNEAMAELDAYLEDDKEKQEQLRKEKEAREAQFRAQSFKASSGPPPKLAQAYKTMGLPFKTPFTEVKTAYKKLLKEHHPDKHGSDPLAQKQATETSARINNAYRVIELWHEYGKIEE
ncbi:hypothetical protein MASR2M29_07560 [Spirochaetota bacterium]